MNKSLNLCINFELNMPWRSVDSIALPHHDVSHPANLAIAACRDVFVDIDYSDVIKNIVREAQRWPAQVQHIACAYR